MKSYLPLLEKALEIVTAKGTYFADIFYEERRSSIIFYDNKVVEKALNGLDCGVGIRIVKDNKSTYGYTNEITKEGILALAHSVLELARVNGIGNKSSSLKGSRSRPTSRNVKSSPSFERSVEIVTHLDKTARSAGREIRQVSILYRDAFRKFIVLNSLGENAFEEYEKNFISINIVASRDERVSTASESLGSQVGKRKIEIASLDKKALDAANRAILLIDAKPAPSGVMPVVIAAGACGVMIHEAVGHGLEGDTVLKGSSVYKGKLGESVASKLVSVVDDPTLQGKYGSFNVDDEGSQARQNLLIENGVLKSYMHSKESAMAFGVQSSGNGRRESYRFRPVVRMTNTFILPGSGDPDEILRSTPEGLFIKKMGGGQVNTVTGEFVFEAQEAYTIRNGLLDALVKNATIAGNGPNILYKIDAVGNDLDFSVGTCGKEGQMVPVSNGGPTVRISEMVVGGTKVSK